MNAGELAHLTYERYYQMIADDVRMQAYAAAIKERVRPGDTVIDLGCGLGILSIWALQAGARHVYAIEQSDSIRLAEQIARRNNCSEQITFIHDQSTNVTLPEKADILISETLGSFGIDENCMHHVLDVRQRLLKDDARILPQSLELYAAAVCNSNVYNKINIWRQVNDIDLSDAFDTFSSKMLTETFTADNLLSQPVELGHIDFTSLNDASFQQQCLMHIQRPGVLHGVAGWFHVHLSDSISISTAPDAAPTHWQQGFFPFRDPIDVIANDVLEWTISHQTGSEHSDHSQLHYHYRCTQIKNEIKSMLGARPTRAQAPAPHDQCPCGSGEIFSQCCGL